MILLFDVAPVTGDSAPVLIVLGLIAVGLSVFSAITATVIFFVLRRKKTMTPGESGLERRFTEPQPSGQDLAESPHS